MLSKKNESSLSNLVRPSAILPVRQGALYARDALFVPPFKKQWKTYVTHCCNHENALRVENEQKIVQHERLS